MQLIQWESSDWLFFTVVGCDIRIFLSDREWVNGYLTSALGKGLGFAYGFQRHKQMTQHKLPLQNKLR